MTHSLIGFLGKARKEDGGKYRTAYYNFDGKKISTQFFGLGLREVIKPQQLIILGTSGSMWDVLYEGFSDSDKQAEHWLELSESVEGNAVSQQQLNICAQDLSVQLGVNCILKLIPYGKNEQEQSNILKIMAADINVGDQVSLDLTHGLRHLPTLGLLSAMYLQTAKQVTINGIYYGALELTEAGKTPVIRLDGLLKIADWISALHSFDKTGDIAPFSPLLVKEGMSPETAALLKTAAFHESVLNIPKARTPLRDFAKETQDGLPGIASLFTESLNERIAWKDQNNIYLRQREKAQFYLQRSDYVRAAALGYEAVITYYLKKNAPNADVENYETRQLTRDRIESELSSSDLKAYKTLRSIRNSVAHANRVNNKEIQRVFSAECNLYETLKTLFEILLPESMN